MASARWNHVMNDKLFLNVNAAYSNYEFSFESGQDDFQFGFESGVVDWSQKAQLSWYPNLRHEVRCGLDHVFHEFVPTSFFFTQGDEAFDFGEATVAYSHESGAYLEDIVDVSDALRVNAGVRYSDFRHVGEFTRIVPGTNLLEPADTIRYAKGDLVGRYGGWEPRLSARLKTGPRTSVKAGWSINYQYVHLASLSATTTPTDVWVPSSDLVPPQRGSQVNADSSQILAPTGNGNAPSNCTTKTWTTSLSTRKTPAPTKTSARIQTTIWCLGKGAPTAPNCS